jgi:ADP-ribose pyrophosphatase
VPAPRKSVVFDTPWMRVVSKRATPRPGATAEDYFVVETEDWTVICPRTADGRFILVDQFRPAVERRLVEFPAGGIDLGESPAASVERELREETGHRIVRLVPLGCYFGDTGRLSNRAHLFFADVEPVGDWTPEPGLVTVSCTSQEIDRKVSDGALAALHHVALWLLVKRAGLCIAYVRDQPHRGIGRRSDK